jgi:hypothetical protein
MTARCVSWLEAMLAWRLSAVRICVAWRGYLSLMYVGDINVARSSAAISSFSGCGEKRNVQFGAAICKANEILCFLRGS